MPNSAAVRSGVSAPRPCGGLHRGTDSRPARRECRSTVWAGGSVPLRCCTGRLTFGKKAAFRRQCIETDLSEFPLSELLFSEIVLQPLPLKPDPLLLEPDPLPLSELLLSEMVFQPLPLKPDPLPLEPLSLGLQSRRIRRRVHRNRKERPLLLERSNA
jgi:hypothetical protein